MPEPPVTFEINNYLDGVIVIKIERMV